MISLFKDAKAEVSQPAKTQNVVMKVLTAPARAWRAYQEHKAAYKPVGVW